MARLEEYRSVVGPDTLEEIYVLAKPLRGKRMLHVNSTSVGGGVAEILNRLVPLLQELGIDCRWQVIKGGEDFFAVTKKFHNGLQSGRVEMTPRDFMIYEDTLDRNLEEMDLEADFIVVHDPQPAAFIKRRKAEGRWVWRCHIDLSRPDPGIWGFLKSYVEHYDACIFSAAVFAQSLRIPEVLIAPSIDPLSDKNRELPDSEVRAVTERLGIPLDKPLVTQVSRFDRLKDPLGVVEAFSSIKPYVDARLLLVGGTADDDPEGAGVLAEVRERAKGDPDILIMALPPTSHLEINAIQRASSVILQKSLREGFGLTVSEALWKGKPVIASAVGGIPLQVAHKYSGLLTHSVPGTSYWLKQLLSEPGYARKLGENGREGVRNGFLLTRHLRDYLLLMHFMMSGAVSEDFIRI